MADWIEEKTAKLIGRARRSQFSKDIFGDAAHIYDQGYAMDVALMISLRYWVGDPVTGEVTGV